MLHRFRKWLRHPLAREGEGAEALATRRRIILQKAPLRRIYEEWYAGIAAELPPGAEPVLEIGSGAGFLRERMPGLIASEAIPCEGIHAALEGGHLPFRAGSLRAIVIVDRLHHFPDVRGFLAEAGRCVRSGGVIVMVEPWITPWSRLLYQRLNDEPCEPEAEAWELRRGSNIALPWMVFARDRAQFEAEFPQWRVERVAGMLPVSYLLTGGVSLRSLAPGWVIEAVRRLERPLARRLGTFAFIVVRRR